MGQAETLCATAYLYTSDLKFLTLMHYQIFLHYITLDCTLRTYVNHHESVSKGLRNVIVQWEEPKKTGCQLLWSISILCVTLLSGNLALTYLAKRGQC